MTRSKAYTCPNCGTVRYGQRQIVRHLLEEARAQNSSMTTNSFEAAHIGAAWGQRIHELRHEDGLVIEKVTDTSVGGARYFLRGQKPAHRKAAVFDQVWVCPNDYRDTNGNLCPRCGSEAIRIHDLDLRAPQAPAAHLAA